MDMSWVASILTDFASEMVALLSVRNIANTTTPLIIPTMIPMLSPIKFKIYTSVRDKNIGQLYNMTPTNLYQQNHSYATSDSLSIR